MTPITPISPSFLTTLCGNSLFSSHSETCGATSRSANARTSFRNCSCSSVNPNIATNYLRIENSLRYHTHIAPCMDAKEGNPLLTSEERGDTVPSHPIPQISRPLLRRRPAINSRENSFEVEPYVWIIHARYR